MSDCRQNPFQQLPPPSASICIPSFHSSCLSSPPAGASLEESPEPLCLLVDVKGVTLWQGGARAQGAVLLHQNLSQLPPLCLGYMAGHFRATSKGGAQAVSEGDATPRGAKPSRSAAADSIHGSAPARKLRLSATDDAFWAADAFSPASVVAATAKLRTSAPRTSASNILPPSPQTLDATELRDRPPQLPLAPNCWFGFVVDESEGTSRPPPLSLFCEEVRTTTRSPK